MHNIKDIRNDPDLFKKSLKKRFLEIDLKKILELDENNRKLIQEKETLEKEKKKFLNQKIKNYLKNLNPFQKKLMNLKINRKKPKLN
jgi:seryl-tRNA synthetase